IEPDQIPVIRGNTDTMLAVRRGVVSCLAIGNVVVTINGDTQMDVMDGITRFMDAPVPDWIVVSLDVNQLRFEIPLAVVASKRIDGNATGMQGLARNVWGG